MPVESACRVPLFGTSSVPFLAVLAWGVASLSLAGQPEPLRTHTVAPFQMARPSATRLMVPSGTDSEWASVSMDFTWGNVWAYGFDEYRVDGEWLWTAFRFEQHSGRASFRMEVPLIGRFGGAVDGTIERVHERLGRGNQFRERAPRNDVLVYVGNSEDSFRLEHSSWDAGDITLAAAWTLCGGDGFAPGLSAEILATVPSGNPRELTGFGKPVYGGGFMATESFGNSPVGLYLGLLYLTTSAETLAGAAIRRHAFSGVGGIECRLDRHWSGVLQFLSQTPVIQDLRELSDPMYEWSVGLRYRWKGGSSFELAFTENTVHFGNSTDLGLHTGWCTVF